MFLSELLLSSKDWLCDVVGALQVVRLLYKRSRDCAHFGTYLVLPTVGPLRNSFRM
jgi:hypothetical protein